MRKPLEIPIPTPAELEAVAQLYRTTRDARLRTRAQIVLLAAEQRLTAPAIATIVREKQKKVWHEQAGFAFTRNACCGCLSAEWSSR